MPESCENFHGLGITLAITSGVSGRKMWVIYLCPFSAFTDLIQLPQQHLPWPKGVPPARSLACLVLSSSSIEMSPGDSGEGSFLSQPCSPWMYSMGQIPQDPGYVASLCCWTGSRKSQCPGVLGELLDPFPFLLPLFPFSIRRKSELLFLSQQLRGTAVQWAGLVLAEGAQGQQLGPPSWAIVGTLHSQVPELL